MRLPEAANLAMAPKGVALEAWPPVLEYTSVSITRTLTFLPVQTAEAYVVGGAVTGDNPLRACGDEAFELDDFAAGVASASLAQGYNLVGDFACGGGVVGCIEPLLSQGFDLVGAFGTFQGFVHKVGYALTHFLGGDVHAEAEFGEVLEE